jgi:hypothetical protein
LKDLKNKQTFSSAAGAAGAASVAGAEVSLKSRQNYSVGTRTTNLRLVHRVSGSSLLSFGDFGGSGFGSSGLDGSLRGRCLLLRSLFSGNSFDLLLLPLPGGFGGLRLLLFEGSEKLGDKTGALGPLSFTLGLSVSQNNASN